MSSRLSTEQDTIKDYEVPEEDEDAEDVGGGAAKLLQ